MRLSELENIIVQRKSPKGLISKIYISLLYSDSSDHDSLKLLWERDLEVTFTPVDWDKICSGIFPKCTSISIHEQNFKFFRSTYYTPFASRGCSLALPTFVINVTHTKVYLSIYFGHVTAFRLSGGVFTLQFRKSLVNSFYWLLLFTYLTMLQTISWTLMLNLW